MAFFQCRKMILLMLFPVAAFAAAPEPTEAEILALTEKDVSSANQPVIEYQKKIGKAEVPPDMLIKVNSVRKIGCKPTEQADSYLCDVEMDLTVPNGGRRTRVVPVRFAKTDDGWKGSR